MLQLMAGIICTIAQVNKSSTSAVRLILGFQGVLGGVAAGDSVFSASSGRVVYSGSSGGSKRNINPHVWVLIGSDMLELLCSGSGKLMVTGWFSSI